MGEMALDLKVGKDGDGGDQHEEVILLLMWTAAEVIVTRNVTADRTTLMEVSQEHSTGIKNTNCNFANL